jgi:NAD kinase
MRALVVCKHPNKSKHSEVCRLINKKNLTTTYSWKNTLTKNQLINIDLIISIGGDGTVLSSSHFNNNIPLLAVNSNPKKSEGALTTLPISQLDIKLDQILKGNFITEKLERIQISINNNLLDLLALNEVFIANEKPYLITKHKIKHNKIKETQKSSGIIISTGRGSTAWFKSAYGTPFSPQAKYIKMIVREPYQGKLNKIILKKAKINFNQTLSITPLVPSVLAIDSIREYPLKRNDKVEIKISKSPLIRII